MKIGRNALCPCGSGKKYKKCCLGKEKSETNPKEDVFLTEPIPDYGVPKIKDDFFDDKFPKMPTAAALQHFMMSQKGIDNLIGEIVNKIIPQDRKERIKEQKLIINDTDDPNKLIDMLNQKIDQNNEILLIRKMLKHSDYIIPEVISRLKSNTNDFFVEFSVRLLKEAKNNEYTKLLINSLGSIKHAYTLSTVCLLLGFIGNKDTIKPIWNIYNFFKDEYPKTTLNQGPLFALYEFKERGLL